MKRIYLVRHCQAEGQQMTAKLTDEGKEQAVQLAEKLSACGIERIVSSPFTRAVESIRPFSKAASLTIEKDNRLIEWVLSGRPLDDWLVRLKNSFADLDICHEGGETGREAMTRGITVVRDVLDADPKNAVMVTHGGLLALMVKHFKPNVGFDLWSRLSNPDVYRLTFDESRPHPKIERVQ
ncbi:MAG TPA: histidine phosphatase family protein [Bacillales bacterium]|nr:histidine phosphatase family protein [Bacillales bacterium]